MLEIKNITKKFLRQEILKNITLSASAGEIVILSGPSGSGKTTLLRIIAGLDTPDTGCVYVSGEMVTNGKKILRRPFERNAGMVFQDFGLWPHMTVEQNICFGLNNRDVPVEQRQSEVNAILQEFEIYKLKNAYPAHLSGGERQRVALARTMVLKPGILLLDEPLSNIHLTFRKKFTDLLQKWVEQSRCCVIFVTHSFEEVRSLSEKVIWLEDGMVHNFSHFEMDASK